MIEFDPNDATKGKHNREVWQPPEGISFEPFSIEKLDFTIDPLIWTLFDENGLIYEIAPHDEEW